MPDLPAAALVKHTPETGDVITRVSAAIELGISENLQDTEQI